MPIKNLVSDYSAVGDGQRAATTATISSGTGILTVGESIFVAGDAVGSKSISIWSGSNYYNGTINGYTSATQIAITPNISFAIAGASTVIIWGTDNSTAFTSWRTYAQSQTDLGDPPILEIPDGNYCLKGGVNTNSMHYNVLNHFTVRGTSGVAANCGILQLSNNELRFGGFPPLSFNRGLTNNGANSARLQTAVAGASTVALVDPTGLDSASATYGSRIVVGRACLLAAYDMQGFYEGTTGFPPNSFFYEWNKITAYDSGAGVVTLETPLTQTYKSTYPRWGSENTTANGDLGGPFTIWVAPAGFENTATLENFTVYNESQSACHMRHVICNNLTMNGPGLYPTTCDTMTLTNCVYPTSLEVDKMVGTVTWNGSTINIIQQQSASPNRLILNGGTVNQLGTAKYTEVNNVAFAGAAKLLVGPSAHGRADRIILNGCTGLAAIQPTSADTGDLGAATSFYSFNAGVMRFRKDSNTPGGNASAARCFVPGTWLYFDGKYLDQVSDVYEDGTYCYVRWANTTDWPFTPVTKLTVHHCPDFTMTNCTGTALEIEDYNNATPRIPLYSYSRRTYTDGATGTTQKTLPVLYGRFVSWKGTVTTPGSVTWNTSEFDIYPCYKSDYTTYTFDPTVACANSGLRTVRAATTATGAQGSDNLPDLTSVGHIFFKGDAAKSNSVFSANNTGAVIVVEYNMDHGIVNVPTAVAPLRLRLRSA